MINRVWLTAATAAVAFLSNTQVSFAQTFNHDFTIDVTSGPLMDERYTGTISVDVTDLFSTGYETVKPTSIAFNFGNVEFTEADDVRDIDADSPRANFQDGEFMGITYIVSRFGDKPTDIPLINNISIDGFAIDNSEFGYVVGENLYRGIVNYTLPPKSDEPNVQSVPESSFWLGFTIIGYWLVRRLV